MLTMACRCQCRSATHVQLHLMLFPRGDEPTWADTSCAADTGINAAVLSLELRGGRGTTLDCLPISSPPPPSAQLVGGREGWRNTKEQGEGGLHNPASWEASWA